jgi:replicative DNA helicase
MDYVRLTKGLADKGKLVPKDEVFNKFTNNTSWFRSLYYYNDKHLEIFNKKGTIAGITDVETSWLVFDFDSEDINEARSDTLELVTRLLTHGFKPDQFNIFFSGNKGFAVEIETVHRFKPEQFKAVTKELAGDLKTFDTKIRNASRIFRIPFTKHEKSGLYKIPISVAQLSELSVEQIKELATDPSNATQEWVISPVQLPNNLLELAKKVEEKTKTDLDPIGVPFQRKLKILPACKEAILQGFFPPGNRSNALIALAAGLKNAGFEKEVTYRMLKGAAELQSKRYKQEPFAKEEIWNNIINVVYGPNWQGATYACRDHEFLQEICKVTGQHQCKLKEKEDIISFKQLADKFKHFATNIEKNRIYTGISELDKRIMLTTSMPIGLLGGPGSGKSSISFDILSNTSKAGVRSMFFSLDMGWPLVYAKMVSRVSGINFEEVIETYKNDSEAYVKYDKMIEEEFPKVDLCFKSGLTVDDIKNIIIKQNEISQDKVKLVVVDYLELLQGPYSDATANTAYLSAKLKDLATDLELCLIVLLQPPKSAGDASAPLTSMRQVKGSSALEQNFRIIFGIYRDGFSPTSPENDNFMTINCLKNTLGPLFSIDLHWEGLRGRVRELTSDERKQLAYLRDTKNEEKTSENEGW